MGNRLSKIITRTGDTATQLAERGRPSSNPISPKTTPGASDATRLRLWPASPRRRRSRASAGGRA